MLHPVFSTALLSNDIVKHRLQFYVSWFQTRRFCDDLFEDIRDGHNLISLLEVLSQEPMVSVSCTRVCGFLYQKILIVNRTKVNKRVGEEACRRLKVHPGLVNK